MKNPEGQKSATYIVDRGGVRGPDGRLINGNFVRPGESDDETPFNVNPPHCDSSTVDQALDYLSTLCHNLDKVS